MTSWDERFRNGEYPDRPEPSPILRHYVDVITTDPEPGRALDVATGTGRNAVFLADRGFEVDAIDSSAPGLRTAREHAAARGVDGNCNWIQADATEYAYPENAYDVVAISFFRAHGRFADLKASLAPGGLLWYQQHLRTTEPVDRGPSSSQHRFAGNELLHGCLDLNVLHYEEGRTTIGGRTGAHALVVARNWTDEGAPYPPTYPEAE